MMTKIFFNRDTILYCSEFRKGVSFLIPKKIGIGYLRSPFGGHHSNDLYWKFISEDCMEYVNNCCDLDGYLYITLNIDSLDDCFKEVVQEIIKSLFKVFPRCTKSKSINRNDFFDIVQNRNK